MPPDRTAGDGLSSTGPNLVEERVASVLLSEDEVQARVRELGQAISRDFADSDTLFLVGVLKGAFVFMSDLGREISRAGGPAVRYEFVRASTYGSDVKASGEVTRNVALDGIPEQIEGQDVLLVEDILDQGFTLAHIRKALLNEGKARSVKLCVLLNKVLNAPTPQVARQRACLQLDYQGFTVGDRWVAGYGLDAAEDFRELPYIAVVREEYYVGT